MTAVIARNKVHLFRFVLGSLIGTLYLLTLFVEPFTMLYSWYGKLALSIAMIITTFGIKRFSLVGKNLIIFYAVSFLFGGGIFGISFLIQGQQSTLDGLLVFEDAFVYPQASMYTLCFGYIVVILMSKFYFNSIEIGKRRMHYILPCKIRIFEHEVEVRGLLDTGNQLYEPLTRIPVIILEIEQVRSFFPDILVQTIRSSSIHDVHWYEQLSTEWQERIRLIPYRGMGSGDQMMIAIIPGSVTIVDGNSEYVTTRVRVGMTNQKLSVDNAYQAILHPSLIQEKAMQKHTNEEVQYAKEMAP